MTSFWFEVFALIGLALVIYELSALRRAYTGVEIAKMKQRENK